MLETFQEEMETVQQKPKVRIVVEKEDSLSSMGQNVKQVKFIEPQDVNKKKNSLMTGGNLH